MMHEVCSAGIQTCLGSSRSTGDFVVVIEDVVDKGVLISPDHAPWAPLFTEMLPQAVT